MKRFFGNLGGSALLACRAFREAFVPPYRFGLVVTVCPYLQNCP